MDTEPKTKVIDASQLQSAVKAPRRRLISPRLQKFIRRTHMYLGLLLIPWVILFGVSGFLFNHGSNTFGGPIRYLAQLSPEESADAAGFAAVGLDTVVQEVVTKINEELEDEFQLADPKAIQLTSNIRFSAKGEKGDVTVALDPVDGSAEIYTVEFSRPEQTRPSFNGQKIPNDALKPDELKKKAARILEAKEIKFSGSMRSGRRSPELRFQLKDQNGKLWNTVYNLGNGQLSGRGGEDDNGMNFRTAVLRLHMTHNYPDQKNARWFWVLLADTTAITLVFWGISGLIMWWQIKPSRVLGLGAITVAAIIGFGVFSGALWEIGFGPSRSRGSSPPASKSGPSKVSQKRTDGPSGGSQRAKPTDTMGGLGDRPKN